MLAFKLRWREGRSAKRAVTMLRIWADFFSRQQVHTLDDIGTEHLADFLSERTEAGDAPATLHQRLSVLKVAAEEALSARPPLATKPLPHIRKPKVLRVEKWWLTPERRAELVPALRHRFNDPLMADYVEFICETGLRVEEALRVRKRHVLALDTERPSLSVPGTKTAGSQKTIPLSPRAASIARYRLAEGGPDAVLFPVSYAALRERWRVRRPKLGLPHDATLKGLRRSYAGKLNRDGVPTEAVMRLMRHANITTTAGYLQLMGASDLENYRHYLGKHVEPQRQAAPPLRDQGADPAADLDYFGILESIM